MADTKSALEIAISGLNNEKETLSSALCSLGHNDAIKVESRLREIDTQIIRLLTL